MVNFEWYRSFVAVYRAGTVTAAAKARSLTQPAISQHIAALETSMRQPLFERATRKMVPTRHGKHLYSRIAPAVDGLEGVSQNLRNDLLAERPRLRIGAPLEYFLEAAIERLSDAPLRLEVEPGETEPLIEALSAGRLDLVIATQHLSRKELDYVKLAQEEFLLVAPTYLELPNAVRAENGDALERFLLEQPWIAYSDELPIIRRYWHSVFRRRPDIEPRMTTHSLLLARRAVELGMGLSVLPRYLCEESIKAKRLKSIGTSQAPVVNELWIATRKVDRNKGVIGQAVGLLQGL